MILQLTEKQKEEINKITIKRLQTEIMRTQQFMEKHGESSIMINKIEWNLKEIQKLQPPKTLEQQEAIADYIELYGREDEWTDETIEQAEQDMIDR